MASGASSARVEALEKRVAALERWRAFVLGAGATATIVLGSLTHTIIKGLGLVP
jgi:glutamyl-tRNA reductase